MLIFGWVILRKHWLLIILSPFLSLFLSFSPSPSLSICWCFCWPSSLGKNKDLSSFISPLWQFMLSPITIIISTNVGFWRHCRQAEGHNTSLANPLTLLKTPPQTSLWMVIPRPLNESSFMLIASKALRPAYFHALSW